MLEAVERSESGASGQTGRESSGFLDLGTAAEVPRAPPPGLTIEFKVCDSHIDTSGLRPITYFPVITTVTGDATSEPELQSWSKNEATRADRRYSEFAAFRVYLSYYHPYVVVPPLLPKTSMEGLKTYLMSTELLHFQQMALQRFLHELGRRRELLRDEAVLKFCRLSREEYLEFHKIIEQKNLDHGYGGVIPTATAYASGFVRAIATWWSSRSSTPAAAGRPPPPANLTERVNVSLSKMPRYQHWEQREGQLGGLRIAIHGALAAASAVIESQRYVYHDLGDVGAELAAFTDVLRCAEAESHFASVVLRCGTLADGAARAHQRELLADELQFVEALRHEEHWIDAAIEATHNIVELLRQHVESKILGESGSGAPEGSRKYLIENSLSLSDRLSADMDAFVLEHQRRMQKIMAVKVHRALRHLGQELKLGEEHPVWESLRTQADGSFASAPELARAEAPSEESIANALKFMTSRGRV